MQTVGRNGLVTISQPPGPGQPDFANQFVYSAAGGTGKLVGAASIAALVLILAALSVAPISASVSAPAVIVPDGRNTEIVAPIAGRLAQLEVGEGQTVQKGQVLFTVVGRSENSNSNGDVSSIHHFQAQLDAIDQQFGSVRRQTISMLSAADLVALRRRTIETEIKRGIDVESDRLEVIEQRREILQAAADKLLISRSELLSSSSELLVARTGMADRRKALIENEEIEAAAIAQTELRLEVLASRKAELKSERARVLLERNRFLETRMQEVRAPFNGTIVSVKQRIGAAIDEAVPVLWLAENGQASSLIALVNERDVDAIEVGQRAKLRLPSSTSMLPLVLSATVTEVSQAVAEKATRTWEPTGSNQRAFEVRLAISDADQRKYSSLLASSRGRSAQVLIMRPGRSLLSYLTSRGRA